MLTLTLSDIVRIRDGPEGSARIAGKEDKMIRILVQLVPGGNEARTRELGRAVLANLSEAGSAPTHSDYGIYAEEGPNPLADLPAWRSRGLVARYDRRQSVWRLVEKSAAWAANQAETDRS